MSKILIVYASVYGNTKKMSEAIADGVKTVKGAEAIIKTAEQATLEETAAADALVLGSPVHMGSPDWRVKQYIDKVCAKLWMEDRMVGKVGAVFTAGGGFGNAGGGCEITLLAMMNNLVELGMIIVPLPKNTPGYDKGGIQWGPYGRTMGEKMEQTGITEERMVAAHYHGIHIARTVDAVKGKEIFSGRAEKVLQK